MHAHSHMTWAPVADNVFLIALPLNCVISPCHADNLRSRGADTLVVATATRHDGSFASHRIHILFFFSLRLSCFPLCRSHVFRPFANELAYPARTI